MYFLVYLPWVIAAAAILKWYFRGTQFTYQGQRLDGATAVITGGSTGIGKETARALASLGCRVYIGARDVIKGQNAVSELIKQTKNEDIFFVQLDLSNRKSIDQFVSKIKEQKVQLLVNNAGIMALPTFKQISFNEGSGKKTLKCEAQWCTNHLGHFYLTYLLRNKLKNAKKPRIINVSSLAHIKTIGCLGNASFEVENMNCQLTPYHPGKAYSKSKLYNVLFTDSLASKLGSKGITASLHPGVVRTELIRQMGKILAVLIYLFYPLYWLFTKNPVEGAQTSIHVCLSDAVKSGAYYSDCAEAAKNPNVTSENADILWNVSQTLLQIKFEL